MKCAIISIGNEILSGVTLDTNSLIISKKLESIGLRIHKKESVADDISDILYSLKSNISNNDILIITGGLGPTSDDKTKEALCLFFNDNLVKSNLVLKDISSLFKNSKYDSKQLLKLEQNQKQALVPSKCAILRNKYGTAPGLWFTDSKKHIVALPGVPYEMEFLLDDFIKKIESKIAKNYVINNSLYVVNIPESLLHEKISSWEKKLPKHLKVSYLPSYYYVKLRLTGVGQNKDRINLDIKKQFNLLKEIIGVSFIREDIFNKNYFLAELLTNNQLSISVAESCTGGNIASEIVAIPGASKYFKGGVVAYNNDIKKDVLKIDQARLNKYGAVSKQVCSDMAKSIKSKMKSDISIATSGYAGSSNIKDSSCSIFISCCIDKFNFTEKINLKGTRNEIINQASKYAINFLIKKIQKVFRNK